MPAARLKLALLCALALAGAQARLFGFGPASIFQNKSRNVRIYWNVPTFMCHKYGMDLQQVSKKFGIIQNERDEFRGDKIAILYDPGNFPALLKDNKDNVVRRNGGVPQEGNLTLHLEYFKQHLIEQIPDKEFSGLGVIDFESWRPIFRQNWASLQIYRDLSLDLERRRHPFWGDKAIQFEATRRFEAAGKIFVLATLELAKRLRPMASWGYYAYPYCFNLTPNQPIIQCAPKVQEENDGMSWLFGNTKILLPSVYLQHKLSLPQNVGLVRGRVAEAARLAAKMQGTNPAKVLAYYWYKFQDQRDKYVDTRELVSTLGEAVKRGADGVIVWGSSEDLRTERECRVFEEYLETTLGPALLQLHQQWSI